jgi:hypothetical protein
MIIAYASANADPINNPAVDAEVDLATASTPVSVTLYGDAVDTVNAGASFSFQWSLLDSDATNPPTLSSTTTQNITVNNISAWHNIRVHLVATNTATSETSETDILLAPTASFSEIRVLSAEQGIQKPAKNSRNWEPVLEDWADAIEGGVSLSVNELSDVTNATGAQLDILVGGGDAEQTGTALHTHTGAHITNATATTAGVVQLEETSSAVGVPRVLVNERVILTGTSDRSIDTGGVVEEIVTSSIPHVLWSATRSELKVHAFTIALADSGAGGTFTFQLYSGSVAQYNAGTLSAIGVSLGMSPAGNVPITKAVAFASPVTVSAGDVLGLVCIASPAVGSGGQMLSVTVECEREVT